MKGIAVYLLDESSRQKLIELYPPRWNLIGHHVTVEFGASDQDELPIEGQYHVVGYAYEAERRPDGSGIEAFVVSIKLPHESRGHIERPDGEIYHITWSYGSGYAAKDSKALVKNGFEKIDPIEINMEAAFIPFK